jgi:hypothetical protein
MYAQLTNPQSLNLYSYVGNEPLSRVDLMGLCWKGFGWACDLWHATTSFVQHTVFREPRLTKVNPNFPIFHMHVNVNGSSSSGSNSAPKTVQSSPEPWIVYQSRYAWWLTSMKINQANYASNQWLKRNMHTLYVFSCFADPGDVMGINDMAKHVQSAPTDPLVGGGAEPIYVQNNKATKNGGQSNILENQEPAAAGAAGAGVLLNQAVQGGICSGQY